MTEDRPAPWRLVAVLAVAVGAVSTAGVLARSATEAAPVAVAFWRVAATAVLLLPFLGRPARGDVGRMALAGALLGAHFATWFVALRWTTVLHSTVLVCLSPVWAGLAERWRAGHLPRPAFWLGVAMAVLGAGLLAGDTDARATFAGDALSVLAGLFGAAYLVIGSGARAQVGIAAYMGWTGLFAAVSLVPWIAAQDVPLTGWSAQTWALIAACAAVPQLLGHGGLNWSLRWLTPPTVTSVLLLEPVGAALLAWIALDETPGGAAVAGCALCVAGVAVAVRR